jgi:hypothetical protein
MKFLAILSLATLSLALPSAIDKRSAASDAIASAVSTLNDVVKSDTAAISE